MKATDATVTHRLSHDEYGREYQCNCAGEGFFNSHRAQKIGYWCDSCDWPGEHQVCSRWPIAEFDHETRFGPACGARLRVTATLPNSR